jgi:hypothetical protein
MGSPVRAAAEWALLSGDFVDLSNNELGRLLGVGGRCVGTWRRRMEDRGLIPHVTVRLGRRGYIDVSGRLQEGRATAGPSSPGNALGNGRGIKNSAESDTTERRS